MNIYVDNIAEQAFALCDKFGITRPSHRERFVEGYREGLRVSPWHKASEELPKDGQHIVMVHCTEYGNAYDTIYYPEPPLTDDMDWWMEIPEIKED